MHDPSQLHVPLRHAMSHVQPRCAMQRVMPSHTAYRAAPLRVYPEMRSEHRSKTMGPKSRLFGLRPAQYL